MSESARRRGVFLDLNGTLVLPVQAESPHEYRLVPNAAQAVAMLCNAGFTCPVVTVQSRVEKGIYSEAEFREWFHSLRIELAAQRAFVEGPYLCPHRYTTPCSCKKPGGLLYRRAAAELGIDLASSFVVGDSREDFEGARTIGSRCVLVRTGWVLAPEDEAASDHVVTDVLAAARVILDLG